MSIDIAFTLERRDGTREQISGVAVERVAMSVRRLVPPLAALAAFVAFPSLAHAGADGVLQPITIGGMANQDFRAAIVGLGIGPEEDGFHYLFFGRAAVGPQLSAGMGGVKGGYAFVQRDHVHFGIDVGISAGGGKYRGRNAGVLAAAEPGLFLRFVAKKLGAIDLNGGWYQPVYVPARGVHGAAMVSIGWSPFYRR